jgi:hypothetical protein
MYVRKEYLFFKFVFVHVGTPGSVKKRSYELIIDDQRVTQKLSYCCLFCLRLKVAEIRVKE